MWSRRHPAAQARTRSPDRSRHKGERGRARKAMLRESLLRVWSERFRQGFGAQLSALLVGHVNHETTSTTVRLNGGLRNPLICCGGWSHQRPITRSREPPAVRKGVSMGELIFISALPGSVETRSLGDTEHFRNRYRTGAQLNLLSQNRFICYRRDAFDVNRSSAASCQPASTCPAPPNSTSVNSPKGYTTRTWNKEQ